MTCRWFIAPVELLCPCSWQGKIRLVRVERSGTQNLNVLIYNNGRLKISKKLWYCGSY
jgi:hypothetical protein